MKKLVLTMIAVAGLSLAAYSQGVVTFANEANINGLVDLQTGSTLSWATSFTVGLYYVSPASGSLTAAPNAYGQLTYAQFLTDGFILSKTASADGAGNPGFFAGGTATTTGVPGGFAAGNYTVSDYLAVAAWTGSYATLAAAEAGSANIGIIAFVNNLGPGGSDPHIPYIDGWNNLTPTPAVVAFEGAGGYPDLVMATPVPEPTTLALAGLGGLALLAFRRRS